jgi:hypothetical protein
MTRANWIDKALVRVQARDDKPNDDPGRIPEGSANFWTIFGGVSMLMNPDDDTNAIMRNGWFGYLSHGSRIFPLKIQGIGALEADGDVIGFETGYLCDDWVVDQLVANQGGSGTAPGTDPGTSGSRLNAKAIWVGNGNVNCRISQLVCQSLGVGGIYIGDEVQALRIMGVEQEKCDAPWVVIESDPASVSVVDFRTLQDDGQGWGANPGPVDTETVPAFRIDDLDVNKCGFRFQGYINASPTAGPATGFTSRKVSITATKANNITLPSGDYFLQNTGWSRKNVSFDFSSRHDYIPAYFTQGIPANAGYADDTAARVGGVKDYQFYLGSDGLVHWLGNSID